MCGGCNCQQGTKEEKVAILEMKEKRLMEKLEFIRKIKEATKSEKAEVVR